MKPTTPSDANDTTSPSNGSVVQLAVRELHAMVSRSKFWILLGGAGVMAALAGPFYTLERMSFPARLIYWGVTAVASGVFMTFLSILMHKIAAQKRLHWLPASLIAGALGTLPIMALIYVANRLSSAPGAEVGFWPLFPFVSVPVILITVLVSAVMPDKPPAPDTSPAAAATSPPADPPSLLFAKLPATLGREIVALQAKDHYIEVTTTKGDALILMRLSDAEQDLAGLDGLRVHRSWWVSLPHVERIEKGTSGPELRMITGQIVPVARGQRALVRSALAARLT